MDEMSTRVYQAIQALLDDPAQTVRADTPLLGDGRVLDSMKLVELCLALEDLAAELGFEFDWTSESAMSRTRSMFRSAGALAEAFAAQQVAAT